jgi:uncharacterized Rmd1/YagE family protein
MLYQEPHLDPLYKATRAYLEISQRVSILNQRLDVIGDLLQMLKEQMSHSHGEYLEWIGINTHLIVHYLTLIHSPSYHSHCG